MGNRWKGEISRTILNIFRLYNRMDVFKFLFLEELYEKTFVVPYVISRNHFKISPNFLDKVIRVVHELVDGLRNFFRVHV